MPSSSSLAFPLSIFDSNVLLQSVSKKPSPTRQYVSYCLYVCGSDTLDFVSWLMIKYTHTHTHTHTFAHKSYSGTRESYLLVGHPDLTIRQEWSIWDDILIDADDDDDDLRIRQFTKSGGRTLPSYSHIHSHQVS